MVGAKGKLKDIYKAWSEKTIGYFNELKGVEQHINTLMSSSYGLNEELKPDVDDVDITIKRPSLRRDIISLLSYAVDCIFGRYSFDSEGLIYAGGIWDKYRYRS